MIDVWLEPDCFHEKKLMNQCYDIEDLLHDNPNLYLNALNAYERKIYGDKSYGTSYKC